jgi:hypothetical protein
MSFNIARLLESFFGQIESTLESVTGQVDSEGAKIPQGDIIPGDVEIMKIFLVSLDRTRSADLTQMVKFINVYEDILSPSLVAEFEVQDLEDLQNNFNIRPGDYIQFSFRSPASENSVDLLLAVHDVSNTVAKENLQLKTYTITALSPEALRNSTIAINFKQKDSASKIVRRIFNDHINTTKAINIDPSKAIEDFPPMAAIRPFAAINYLTRFAYSNKYESNAFVFFENKKGYYFTTIEKLIEQGVKAQEKGSRFTDKEFFFDLAANEDKRNLPIRNIVAYKKISTNSFNDMSKISTIVNTYDLTRGNYVKTVKTVGDMKFNLLEGSISDSSSSTNDPAFDLLYGKQTTSVSFIPISTDTMPKEYGEYVANRLMFASKLEQDTVQIFVYGDTELCVGDVIKCNFPNISANGKDQTRTEVESGNYLITSLRHLILNTDRPQHMISIEMKRNRTT